MTTALLSQRAGTGVRDRPGQPATTREHITKIGRRRSKPSITREAVKNGARPQ